MPKDYKKFLEGQTLSYLLAEPSSEQLSEDEDGTKETCLCSTSFPTVKSNKQFHPTSIGSYINKVC